MTTRPLATETEEDTNELGAAEHISEITADTAVAANDTQ